MKDNLTPANKFLHNIMSDSIIFCFFKKQYQGRKLY